MMPMPGGYWRSPRRQGDISLILALAAMVVGIVAVWYFTAAVLTLLGGWTILLVAALGGWVFHKSRQLRVTANRAVAGLCVKCGYDLRSSPDRCPECGEPLPEDYLRRRKIFAELSKARGTSATAGGPQRRVVQSKVVELGAIPLEAEPKRDGVQLPIDREGSERGVSGPGAEGPG